MAHREVDAPLTPTFPQVATAFLILLTVFRLLDRVRPKAKRMPLRRRGFWTDAAYFAAAPITGRLVDIAQFLLLAPLVIYLYGRVDSEILMAGHGPLAGWPLWLQGFSVLFLGDFIAYWMHRAFHGRRLWPFHAVHHSSVDLDWLSSVRLHPVNDLVMKVASAVPLLLLGFKLTAVAAALPVLTLLAFLNHSNVDWDFGPLRKVIVSPRFHRWHHTDEDHARDKNFAGLFPLWDILFGTYYMPKDRLPHSFGTSTEVPDGFAGQIAFPFRRKPAAAPKAANTPQS